MILLELTAALALSMFSMACLWLISGRGKQAAWVDLGWSGLIGLLAIYFGLVTEGDALRRLVLAILPAIWAARLTAHMYKDRIAPGHQDTRYQQLHADWGAGYKWLFFIFFQMQAVLAFLLALPLYLSGISIEPLSTPFLIAGILLFCVASTGETVADSQLSRFKARAENQGQVCKTGLWRYSRHPNYFFEWLHWLSYAVLTWETAFWWTSVLVALVMLTLLLFVTGIPPTEAQSLKNRGAAYRKYQKTTPAFFPWFPEEEA